MVAQSPEPGAHVLNARAFRIELEFRNVGFCGEGKTGVPGEKPLEAEKSTNNKLNPHMTSSPGIEPGPHCESTRLPPMWPGFESWRPHHMWVECVVGSLPCYERFFSGYSGFPRSLKTNTPQFIWNARTRFNDILKTPKCFVGKQIAKFTILVVGMSKRVVAPNTVTAELFSCHA